MSAGGISLADGAAGTKDREETKNVDNTGCHRTDRLFAHAVIWNYFAWCRPPQQTGEATVVVLGCKVNGEEPSLMLRRRLECAMEYLAENPQADCVVSGGMGDNESYTEAHVMKKFLVEHGIDAERVYEEDRSTSTETNLLYSLALVKEEDLSQNIILCTDGFISFVPGCMECEMVWMQGQFRAGHRF